MFGCLVFGLVDRAYICGLWASPRNSTKRGVLSDLLRYGVQGSIVAIFEMAGLIGIQEEIWEKCCMRSVSALSSAMCCAKVHKSAGEE